MGISFDRVEKRFGNFYALRQVSLEIAAGEFVALLGPNGAGKTTLLRLAGLLAKPSAGAVKLSGAENAEDSLALKRRIGIVAHEIFLYDELTARENLEFFGKLYGVRDLAERVERALKGAGLAERGGSLVRTFSRGMRQRLAIARALLAEPSVLLLDEPATGLDRDGVAWLAATLAEWKARGCTILVSTHTRSELMPMVTRAIALERGRVVRDSGAGGDAAAIVAATTAEN